MARAALDEAALAWGEFRQGHEPRMASFRRLLAQTDAERDAEREKTATSTTSAVRDGDDASAGRSAATTMIPGLSRARRAAAPRDAGRPRRALELALFSARTALDAGSDAVERIEAASARAADALAARCDVKADEGGAPDDDDDEERLFAGICACSDRGASGLTLAPVDCLQLAEAVLAMATAELDGQRAFFDDLLAADEEDAASFRDDASADVARCRFEARLIAIELEPFARDATIAELARAVAANDALAAAHAAAAQSRADAELAETPVRQGRRRRGRKKTPSSSDAAPARQPEDTPSAAKNDGA